MWIDNETPYLKVLAHSFLETFPEKRNIGRMLGSLSRRLYYDRRTRSADDFEQLVGRYLPGPEIGVTIPPAVERIPRVVAMH